MIIETENKSIIFTTPQTEKTEKECLRCKKGITYIGGVESFQQIMGWCTCIACINNLPKPEVKC